MNALRQTTVASPIPVDLNSKTSVLDDTTDANVALMELEKGLRSSNIGEQCEAIVKLSSILEKFPFPLLVNSAFLKLAEVFRTGSNFLKLCVLKAIQSCKKHLDKIFNVDEFCRRFFAVIHSNDPIARAVTLRVFGNISSIIADRKNIHHCIRTSLDSHDSVEVEAAIFATKCFAEQSRDFAGSIWQSVAKMIKGLQTPNETKVRLIPIMRYMYHDVNMSKEIFTLCKELLSSYPGYRFTMIILNTTTQLAVATLINIPQQVELLLEYLKEDARRSVNLIAVNNLFVLARSASHLWLSEHIKSLVSVAMETLHQNIKQKILIVLSLLSESNNCSIIFPPEVLQQLDILCIDLDLDISTSALKVKIQILTSRKDLLNDEQWLVLDSDLQMLFALSLSENSMSSLKKCLSALKVFLRHQKDSSLIAFISECLPSMNTECLLEVLHSLVTLSTEIDDLCTDYVTTFTSLLSERVSKCENKKDRNILVALLTLTFQACSSQPAGSKLKLQEELLHSMATLSSREEFWILYRACRQASRLGYATFSSRILNLLTTKVSSESLYFWLKSLQLFQEGEATLIGDDVDSILKLQETLMKSHNAYQDGLTNLKAAITTDHPLYFQFKYARLRADTVRAYNQLLTCCAGFKFNPPPSAIIKQCASTGQDPHQFSRIAVQFQNCAGMFNTIALGYENLHKISFNADQTSLNVIKCLQESCQLIIFAINSLLSSQSKEQIYREADDVTTNAFASNFFLRHCNRTNKHTLEQIKSAKATGQNVDVEHVNCLTSIVISQLKIPFTYPLFYFKRQQHSYIQLSVSPAATYAEEPFTVLMTHQMTLKVEGVILNSPQSITFRQPGEVLVTLLARPNEDVNNPSNQHKPVQLTEIQLRESVIPHHDYFSAEFLIPFKYVGRHTLKVTGGIKDQLGVEWETGASCTIYVDVLEPGTHHMRKK